MDSKQEREFEYRIVISGGWEKWQEIEGVWVSGIKLKSDQRNYTSLLMYFMKNQKELQASIIRQCQRMKNAN